MCIRDRYKISNDFTDALIPEGFVRGETTFEGATCQEMCIRDRVNGFRGDTSIRKRIEHDLYYIENWTLGFDFKILFLTFFKGFVNKNAY